MGHISSCSCSLHALLFSLETYIRCLSRALLYIDYISNNYSYFPLRLSHGLQQPIKTSRIMFGRPRSESCCLVRKEARGQRVSPIMPMEIAPSLEILNPTSLNSSPSNQWVFRCCKFPHFCTKKEKCFENQHFFFWRYNDVVTFGKYLMFCRQYIQEMNHEINNW